MWGNAKDITVKVLTLFDRVESLTQKVIDTASASVAADRELDTKIQDASQRISRLEGASQVSPTSELMRQVAELQRRVAVLEATRSPGIIIDTNANRHPPHQIEPPQIDGGNGQ